MLLRALTGRLAPMPAGVILVASLLIGCGSSGGEASIAPGATLTSSPTDGAVAAVSAAAVPWPRDDPDFEPLLQAIGDSRWVLIGEASHGTHEFYATRAAITRRLIEQQGCAGVVVEADWPHAYRVNRYVRGSADDRSAEQALRGFGAFPDWMWRNRDVEEFVGWLREHNASRPETARAGFYGMDLYSLYESMDAVVSYLERIDRNAARRAQERYACFEDFAEDPQRYGQAAARSDEKSCREEVLEQLHELQAVGDRVDGDGPLAEDEAFTAEQNARVAHNAERFYRALYDGRGSTWNLRDRHMAETLDALAGHLERDGESPRLVVWAHNSHLGDARATSMSDRGELNVGQLMRQEHGRETFSLGFSTYSGSVFAARQWGGRGERRTVMPALAGSYEALFHDVAAAGPSDFLVDLRRGGPAQNALSEERLERAIGVIYRPETERWSHYFEAVLTRQFDAVIHFDETSAVEPLAPVPAADERPAELPPTDAELAEFD